MTHHLVAWMLLLEECHIRTYELQTSRTICSAILHCRFRYKQTLDPHHGTLTVKHVGHEHTKSESSPLCHLT